MKRLQNLRQIQTYSLKYQKSTSHLGRLENITTKRSRQLKGSQSLILKKYGDMKEVVQTITNLELIKVTLLLFPILWGVGQERECTPIK